MKKVILVSPYPYTNTGRGMDVLTSTFDEAEGWEVSHLTFPKVFYTVGKKSGFSKTVKELSGKQVLFPYFDRLMYWFPLFLFNWIKRHNNRSARHIRWEKYDYVVIESGKPLFLLEEIPYSVKIIYRQSDSVKRILGKNRYYQQLEDQVFERASQILVVKELEKQLIPQMFEYKVRVIRNGFSLPEQKNLPSPYNGPGPHAVYVGLTPLDVKTLIVILRKVHDLKIHIFGSCLRPWDVLMLKTFNNIHYYGFQPQEVYVPYLQYADLAIYPFKDWGGMKHVGFTTKYLNFMYYGLPIISYLTGSLEDFTGLPIIFASDPEDFAENTAACANNPVKIDYQVDWDFFSLEGRKKEYHQLIRSLE